MEMNAQDVQSEDDVKGYDQPVEGTYHLMVLNVESPATDKDKNAMNADRIGLSVLAGNVPGQEGKTANLLLWRDDNGNPQDEHLRFALVVKLIQPGQAGNVELKNAEGRDFVGQLKTDKKGYLKLYADCMFSTENPKVASVKKDERVIAARGQAAPAGNGQGQQQQQQQPIGQPVTGAVAAAQGQAAPAGVASGGAKDEWAGVV